MESPLTNMSLTMKKTPIQIIVLTMKIKAFIANYKKSLKIQRKNHNFKQQVELDEHEIAMTI